MSDESKKLQVGIKVTADTSGAKETEAAIGRVESATRSASAVAAQSAARDITSSSNLAKATKAGNKSVIESFASLGQTGEAARQAVRGVGQAAQGGVSGVFGLAQSVRGLLSVIKGGIAASGPLGIIITVLGTVGGLVLALRDRFSSAGDAAKQTGTDVGTANKALDQTKISATAAEQTLKDLAEKGMTDASNKAKDLEDSFDKAAKALSRTATAAAEVRAAENEVAIARVNADEAAGRITTEQADASRFQLQRSGAGNDLAAQQKLAEDQKKLEASRVGKLKDEYDTQLGKGVVLGETQNNLLGQRSGAQERVKAAQEADRLAEQKRTEEIADLEKRRSDLVEKSKGGLEALPEIRGIDEQIEATKKRAIDERRPLAAQVASGVKEINDLDPTLASVNQELAETNAGLVVLGDKLKTTRKAAAERQKEIEEDISTTTKVRSLKQDAADITQQGKVDASVVERKNTVKKAADEVATAEATLKREKAIPRISGDPDANASILGLEKQLTEKKTQEAKAKLELKGTLGQRENLKAVTSEPFNGPRKETNGKPKSEPGTITGPDGVVHQVNREERSGPGSITYNGETRPVDPNTLKGPNVIKINRAPEPAKSTIDYITPVRTTEAGDPSAASAIDYITPVRAPLATKPTAATLPTLAAAGAERPAVAAQPSAAGPEGTAAAGTDLIKALNEVAEELRKSRGATDAKAGAGAGGRDAQAADKAANAVAKAGSATLGALTQITMTSDKMAAAVQKLREKAKQNRERTGGG